MPRGPMRELFTFTVAIGLTSCGQSAGNGQADATRQESNAVAVAVSARSDGPEVAPVERPEGPVVFTSALGLPQRGSSVEPQLRHASVATPADWPASFFTTFKTARGEASCTSVLIGPEVLLTAAHCIPPDKTVGYSFKGAAPLTAHCTRHPKWETGEDLSADFALCHLDQPFVEPEGFHYETINTRALDPDSAPVPVILTGFGCTDDSTSNRKIDGQYRFGYAVLVGSSRSRTPTYGAEYYAANGGQSSNLFTEKSGPNLCPGDSGGPALLPSNPTGARQHADRTIIGVNSRVFYADSDAKTYGASMISALGFGQFRPWAMSWLVTNSHSWAACGLNGALPNCRV